MAVYNIPYNPQTDPKALFAQGAQNVIGGLLQGRQRRKLIDFAGGMDPEATAMQIVTQALSGGISPQIAMGLGGLQQRMRPSVGAQPWASTQMTPGQRQNWLDNYGRGVTIQTGQKLLPAADRMALAEADRDKALGKTGPGFGPSDKKALGEEMDKRLDNARRGFFGRVGRTDYPEDALFRQWQDLIAANTFDNDNQRENAWAVWKAKVNKRGKDWLVDNEVDWDPTDPKWREAIGLKAEVKTPTPTGGDIIGTLQGTPAQRKAIDAVVKRPLAVEQKQTLVEQILRGGRIMVKDNSGKVGSIPFEELADWLEVSGNTLAVQDRRK